MNYFRMASIAKFMHGTFCLTAAPYSFGIVLALGASCTAFKNIAGEYF